MMLSIIVPVYNKALYIDECISSILNQTYTDFELILVNDGSTDLSGVRCRHYAGLDPRIILIEQANAGVSAARNAGLDCAKGKYICFVDSDDSIERDMYALLMKNIINFRADISVCLIATSRNGMKSDRKSTGILSILEHSQALSSFLKGDLEHNVNNKIYASDILKDMRFGGIIYEDILFVCKAFLNSRVTVFVPAIKYNYMIRNSSVSMEGFSNKYLETIEVSAKIVDLVVINDRGCLAEAMEFDVMANISLLNILLLLKDQKTYRNSYRQVLDTLSGYDQFIRSSATVRKKHKYAWRLFSWSPKVYKYAMWIYCSLVGTDTIKRIR